MKGSLIVIWNEGRGDTIRDSSNWNWVLCGDHPGQWRDGTMIPWEKKRHATTKKATRYCTFVFICTSMHMIVSISYVIEMILNEYIEGKVSWIAATQNPGIKWKLQSWPTRHQVVTFKWRQSDTHTKRLHFLDNPVITLPNEYSGSRQMLSFSLPATLEQW